RIVEVVIPQRTARHPGLPARAVPPRYHGSLGVERIWLSIKGERRDSNPRPPGPQPGALPAELRPPRTVGGRRLPVYVRPGVGRASSGARVATVVIVEDDPVLQQGMRRHLSAAGFGVEPVDDGDRALRKLRFEKPDLVVLDLMIPGTDGWALLDQVRAEGDET